MLYPYTLIWGNRPQEELENPSKSKSKFAFFGWVLFRDFESNRSQFTYAINDILNGVRGSEKFFFPASGQLFFKDAVFGKHGDLIVTVMRNGMDIDEDADGASPIPVMAVEAPHHAHVSEATSFEINV